MLHSLFYLETAVHVSGCTTTHHQESKLLYLQQLVFVTPLRLSTAIVEEMELVWVYHIPFFNYVIEACYKPSVLFVSSVKKNYGSVSPADYIEAFQFEYRNPKQEAVKTY